MATACEDKLDEPQKGVYTLEMFYQTDEDAQNALNGMYDEFAKVIANGNNLGIHNAPFFAFNLCGDDMYAAGEFYGDNDFMSQLNEFRYATDHEDLTPLYGAYYSAILGANLVINKIPEAGEMSEIKKRCVAEARVVRAYCHMQLGIGWYDPPKVTKDLDLSAGEADISNSDHIELLTWCADECMDAMADLEDRKGVNDKDGTVKVTKGFAQFVAGKAYMFAGKFDESKKALKPLVESENYALVPGERIGETFVAAGDGNEEQIMAGNVAVNTAVSTWSGNIQRSTWMYVNIMNWRADHMAGCPEGYVNGWGGLGIREDFAADFVRHDCGVDPGDPQTKDGKVGGFDVYGDNNNNDFSKYDPYAYEKDPKKDQRWRRKAYIRNVNEFLYEMSYGSGDAGKSKEDKEKDANRGIKTYLYGQTHFLEFKRVARASEIYPGEAFSTRNNLIARLGEAYLLYAEACARTGEVAEGLKYLNKIQERAGSATITTTSDKDELLKAVKEEKRFELFAEGCRWPDMVRWSFQDKGDGVDYFERVRNNGKTVPELYDAMFDANGKEKGVGDKEAKHRIYVYATHPNDGRGTVGFTEPADAPDKYKYYPIPFKNINANKYIKQHAGW